METKSSRHYLNSFSRRCEHCQRDFETWNKAARYCSERCRTDASTARRIRSKKDHWLTTPVICGVCGQSFLRTRETGPNKKYCSPECIFEARARYQKWWREADIKKRQAAYNRERARKHGPDTVWNRVKKRYPDLPVACEAKGCGESRVLEIAHKPEFKRNGAWRTMDKYERHMFWVLCPTCHRVLDRGIETPEQMGLP